MRSIGMTSSAFVGGGVANTTSGGGVLPEMGSAPGFVLIVALLLVFGAFVSPSPLGAQKTDSICSSPLASVAISAMLSSDVDRNLIAANVCEVDCPQEQRCWFAFPKIPSSVMDVILGVNGFFLVHDPCCYHIAWQALVAALPKCATAEGIYLALRYYAPGLKFWECPIRKASSTICAVF